MILFQWIPGFRVRGYAWSLNAMAVMILNLWSIYFCSILVSPV